MEPVIVYEFLNQLSIAQVDLQSAELHEHIERYHKNRQKVQDMEENILGKELKRLRKERKLSQEEVAECLQIRRQRCFVGTGESTPISRADSLLMQMKDKEGKCFSYENLRSGLTTTLYGAFVKLVIADRLAVIADTVLNGYKSYGGFILFLLPFAIPFKFIVIFHRIRLWQSGYRE